MKNTPIYSFFTQGAKIETVRVSYYRESKPNETLVVPTKRAREDDMGTVDDSNALTSPPPPISFLATNVPMTEPSLYGSHISNLKPKESNYKEGKRLFIDDLIALGRKEEVIQIKWCQHYDLLYKETGLPVPKGLKPLPTSVIKFGNFCANYLTYFPADGMTRREKIQRHYQALNEAALNEAQNNINFQY